MGSGSHGQLLLGKWIFLDAACNARLFSDMSFSLLFCDDRLHVCGCEFDGCLPVAMVLILHVLGSFSLVLICFRFLVIYA